MTQKKHMINDYLERSIQNKLRICSLLQNKREISLNEIAQETKLSQKSVISLLQEMQNAFQGIAEIHQELSNYSIQIYDDVHTSELFYSIYSNSNILRCLQFMIMNESNRPISDFADENFLTLPTVYRIRKTCVEYLERIGLQVQKNQIVGEEYRIRFFIALLYYKCGIDCCGIDSDSIRIIREFVLSTNSKINMKFLENTIDEYGYFECLMILSWKRRNHPIKFEKSKKLDALKESFVYPELIESIQENIEKKLNVRFGEKEYDYMFLVYNCTNNCLFSDKWTKEDIELINEIVFADKEFQSLITCFEEKCRKSLRSSGIFQSTMVRFYKRGLFDLQCIIPDRQFYFDFINDTVHLSIIKIITGILKKWRVENGIKYPFDRGHIYYLAVQFSNIIKRNMPPVQVVLLSDIIAEIKTWEIFLNRSFSQKRISIKSILINAEDITSLSSLENSVIVVKKVFRNYLKELNFKNNVYVIPSSLEINSFEYKEISKGIMNCEQSILENFVMKCMDVGE